MPDSQAPAVMRIGADSSSLLQTRQEIRQRMADIKATVLAAQADILRAQNAYNADSATADKAVYVKRLNNLKEFIADSKTQLGVLNAQMQQIPPKQNFWEQFGDVRALRGFTAMGAVQSIGVVAAGTALKDMVVNWKENLTAMAEAQDQVGRLANQYTMLGMRVGLAAKDVQGLTLVAKMSGSSVEQMVHALSILSRGIANTGQASGMQDAMAMQLGLSPEDMNKRVATLSNMGIATKTATGGFRDTREILMDIADVFARMPDGIGKAALAMELFGRQGAEMIPTLNRGSAAIRAMIQEASQLGIAADDIARLARAHEELELAEGRVGLATQGLRSVLGDTEWATDILNAISRVILG